MPSSENTNTKKKDNSQNYFIEDTIYHVLEWLKRLWIFILIFAVVGASAMVLYTYKTYTPSYSASATFTVNVDVATSSADSYNKATAQQLAKTFPNILTSSSLNKIICKDLGVNEVKENITATVLDDTNLFTITVTSFESPQKAYNVLSSVINSYPKVAKFIIGSTQLKLIDASSVTTKPTNYPNYSKKALLGCAAGAILVLAIILLLGLTTSTIIRGDDITEILNTSVLASVPEITAKKRSNSRIKIPNVSDKNVNYKFRESIFSARNTVIRKCKENDIKTILVSSTISGEGKSIVAMNLARSIALKGYKTCLVDFDLRIPSIADYMNIDNDINSISDYIKGNAEFKNCVYGSDEKNFYIAVEKNNNDDASELVGGDKAKEFVKKLEEFFEFIIIDTPPVGYLSDAIEISSYTDGIVYVIAQNTVSKKRIADGLANFNTSNAKIIGCVLNRITRGSESLSYGKYSYRKYRYSKYNKYENTNSENSNDNEIVDLKLHGIEFDD